MPLLKSKKKAKDREMEEGKSNGKPLAIAYSMKRKGMSKGGGVKGALTSEDRGKMSGKSGMIRLQRDTDEKGVNQMGSNASSGGMSKAGNAVREAEYGYKGYPQARGHVRANIMEQRNIKGPTSGKSGFAEGGDVKDPDEIAPISKETADEFKKGMCPSCGYSEGGMIANEDEPMADFMPNEFDDLHLRDDLSSSYTGKNSGDEDGSKLNQEKSGLVDRIMKKRKRG